MELVRLTEAEVDERSDQAFENLDEVLHFLRNKDLQPSLFIEMVRYNSGAEKKKSEILHKLDEEEKSVELLKEAYSRDSVRFEKIHERRGQIGFQLLSLQKEREKSLHNFTELKVNYEDLIAKQFSDYVIKGQVKLQQQSSTASASSESDPESNSLQEKIREIGDEIASLEDELTRKNHSIKDLEKKLEQVQRSVGNVQLVTASTPSSMGFNDINELEFQPD